MVTLNYDVKISLDFSEFYSWMYEAQTTRIKGRLRALTIIKNKIYENAKVGRSQR